MVSDSIEELFNLRLKVLKKLFQGLPFQEIEKEYQDEFEELNYKEIVIDKAHRLTFSEDGELIGAYPVNPNPTDFKITIEGMGDGFAMCAIDALGIAYTFLKTVHIKAKDHLSGANLEFSIDPTKNLSELEKDLNASIYVSYISNKYDSLSKLVAANATLAQNVCPNILFHSSPPNLDNTNTLDFKTAMEEAILIFGQSQMKDHFRNAIQG